MALMTTKRCLLRELVPDDAPFVLGLLNDPAFLEHIGDKHVRDEHDAQRHIGEGPMQSYRRHGYGMWAVVMRASGELAGLCGLVRRDFLSATDLGFAFLPRFRGIGLGYETASAVVDYARTILALPRLLAIVSDGNTASIALLARLEFRAAGTVTHPETGEQLLLYELLLAAEG